MNPLEGDEQQYRVIVALAAVLAGCAVIGLLTFALPWPEAGSGEIQASALLLDRASNIYPLTIQNVMWLMCFFGLGELWVRFHRATGEAEQFGKGLLPEDESTMLRGQGPHPLLPERHEGQAGALFPAAAPDRPDRATVSDSASPLIKPTV